MWRILNQNCSLLITTEDRMGVIYMVLDAKNIEGCGVAPTATPK